jgi:folate-binding protein YgfZ
MPNLPSDEFLAEYESATSSCGYWPLPNWTTVSVAGADRSSFLHNMGTNDIRKLEAGDSCEAFFTDVKGKIVAHTLIIARQEELVLLTVPNQAEQIISHLDRYVIREDVQLRDEFEQNTWVAIIGPDAHEVYSNSEAAKLIVQPNIAGTQGILVCCPTIAVEKLANSLQSSSAKPLSEPVWTALRVESGLPLFGVDFEGSNLPQEVNRNKQAISFTKGCYLGQETIARIDALGHVNKQLISLQFAGEQIPAIGSPLTDDGKEVGSITSASWSPREKAPLALAMVRRGSNEVGKKINSDCGQATVIFRASEGNG